MEYNEYTISNVIAPIRILLGHASECFSDEEIISALNLAEAEIMAYCNFKTWNGDSVLTMLSREICVMRLNQKNSEGLLSQSYSGSSENYVNGYPEHIKSILNRYRKIKVI